MDIKRKYIVDTLASRGKVCQLLTNGSINDMPLTTGKALGIAQDSVGTIMLKGLSQGHVGLTVGANYYYDTNGIISTNIGTYIGTSLSPTEIFMNDYIID
jgi:hypothetical protein